MKNTLRNLRNEISVATKKLIRYYDIGFIFNNLESLLILHIPCKKTSESEEEYVRNKEIALKALSTAQKTSKNVLQELKLRTETFEQIRKKNPDFCENMHDKVSNDDYREYISLVKQFSQKISSLLLYSVPPQIHEDYLEVLLQNKDKVSEIIDSKESSRISYIEDTFVLSELDSINYSIFDAKTLKDIYELRASLISRIKQYEFFDNLYKKGNLINIQEREI